MIVIRQAKMADLNCLMEISTATGSGMSSMPTNLGSWQNKLQASEDSFARKVTEPGGEIYFLVMEDTGRDLSFSACNVLRLIPM